MPDAPAESDEGLVRGMLDALDDESDEGWDAAVGSPAHRLLRGLRATSDRPPVRRWRNRARPTQDLV